jgi:mono/diheme cytochrome c family protein
MMKHLVTLGLLAAVCVSSASAQGADGKAVYDANCKKCHGATGKPAAAMVKMHPKLAAFDAAFFAKRDDASVVDVLTKGKGPDMKAFPALSDAEKLAVSKYIHTLGK